MLLIPDNTTLLRFIPNTFTTLQGEPKLYDKMREYLVTAESWLTTNLIPAELLERCVTDAQSNEDPYYHLSQRLVALKAWLRALPSLDVVISANGIQVIETNNTKPASKAKVDKLLESLKDEIDDVTAQLIEKLHTIRGWVETEQAEWFRSTLFQDLGFLRTLGIRGDWWDCYKALHPVLTDIEDGIARDWISAPVLAQLRAVSLTRRASKLEQSIANKVRTAVRKTLLANQDANSLLHFLSRGFSPVLPPSYHAKAYPELEEALSQILRNSDCFPGWRGTPQAAFFTTPGFVNRKESTSYFL